MSVTYVPIQRTKKSMFVFWSRCRFPPELQFCCFLFLDVLMRVLVIFMLFFFCFFFSAICFHHRLDTVAEKDYRHGTRMTVHLTTTSWPSALASDRLISPADTKANLMGRDAPGVPEYTQCTQPQTHTQIKPTRIHIQMENLIFKIVAFPVIWVLMHVREIEK